ncbi:MAG: SDR family NAD(P)-dependent oxidoreductase, partial [Mycobacterium sp.]|nr:SDR family NAD(P)-dependent oxidoreductase [Mycobacterium sp.]
VAGEVPDPVGSAVWGLVRSAQSEDPGRVLLLDLEPTAGIGTRDGIGVSATSGVSGSLSVADVNVVGTVPDTDEDIETEGLAAGRSGAVAAERDGVGLSSSVVGAVVDSGEPEVAVRRGCVWVPRLVREPGPGALQFPASGWRLEPAANGALEELVVTSVAAGAVGGPGTVGTDAWARGDLGVGEVLVQVCAVGLNFRDVLIGLGMYPDPEARWGSELAGVVVEVGAGVDRLRPGEQVMGLALGSLADSVRVDHRLLVPVPVGWSVAQAATTPVAFATAWYALRDLAGLQTGETIVIHAAAGGVGMAAVQLAHHWGARVLATASEPKQAAVIAAGVAAQDVSGSRTVEFADRFLDLTDGRGADVVLDALAGEFVDASLRLLPRGGRFVEMGKADIRDPQVVAVEHPGVVYQAFDLMDAGPDRLAAILSEVMGLFADGDLRPLPLRAWPIQRAGEALRYFSQARHIGKLALTFPAVLPVSAYAPDPGAGPERVAGDRTDGLADIPGSGSDACIGDVPGQGFTSGTVVVTGGTSGLGVVLARHLVAEYGVRSLVLASRRGADAAGVEQLVEELEGRGARVCVVTCDVSVREQVTRLLDAVPQEAPLTGVVHAAGLLDDGVVAGLTRERVRPVLGAKAGGAWWLHEELRVRGIDVGLFVLFSSLAGVMGAAGQASYAAANGFLDALAEYRSAQGLAGTSIAWGLWAESTGLTAHLGDTHTRRMKRAGFGPLTEEQGLAWFDEALRTSRAAVTAVPVDTTALAAASTAGALPVLLSDLVPATRPTAVGAPVPRTDLHTELAGRGRLERIDILERFISRQASTVLGYGNPLEPDASFVGAGFDSLTAMELRSTLNAAAGIALAPMAVFEHGTVAELARHVDGLIAADDSGEQPIAENRAQEPDTVADIFARAVDTGNIRGGLEFIRTAADLREVFDSPDAATPRPVVLRGEPTNSPCLIMVGTPVFTGGVHQHVRLADALEGKYPVTSIPLPGFGADDPLPATAAVALESTVASVLEVAGDEKFVLAGYSSGGNLAYAIAAEIHRRVGDRLRGVVLIDTFAIVNGAIDLPLDHVIGEMLSREGGFGNITTPRLTAMVKWQQFLTEYDYAPAEFDVLLIRCTTPCFHRKDQDVLVSPWWAGQQVVDVDADHFSVISTAAAAAAAPIARWLGDLDRSEKQQS